MRGWVGAGLAVGLALACGEPETFWCVSDTMCGAGGACQPIGLCSFDDGECESGQRYGEHSGALAGKCVDPDASTTTGDDDDDVADGPDDDDDDDDDDVEPDDDDDVEPDDDDDDDDGPDGGNDTSGGNETTTGADTQGVVEETVGDDVATVATTADTGGGTDNPPGGPYYQDCIVVRGRAPTCINEDETCVEAMIMDGSYRVCAADCVSDDDCPAPDGEGAPVCSDRIGCALPCGGGSGSPCPEGMACVPGIGLCAWPA